MAKAAKQLGVSTPSISELISGLEQVLGARLLDRTSRGVVATACGEVLLTRGRAAFDELRQGFRHIEFMSSSAAGEVRIACPELLAHFLVTNVLFEDPFAIVVGRRSKWGRRRKVDLLELAEEKWVLNVEIL